MDILPSLSFFVIALLLVGVCVKCDSNANEDNSSLIGQLLKRIEALEGRDAVQQKLIDNLQSELYKQKGDIGRMKQSMAKRDRRIRSLLWFMRHKEAQNKNGKLTGMADRSNEGTALEKEERKERRIRQTENEVTVAFSAAVSKTMSTPGSHQNIVFDHVFTNLGNGYNSHHGVFLAPVTGTYVFFMTIYAANNHDIWCQFMVNGTHKSSVYAKCLNSVDDASSQTIILQLKQGDDVAIQLIRGSSEVFGSVYYYSTFSGFLLKQDLLSTGTIVG